MQIQQHPLSQIHNTTAEDDLGNANVAKVTAMAVLFLASFTLGNLPIKLSTWFKWHSNAKDNQYVKMLLGFGGGVLLCTTYLHLLPEVSENFDALNLTPDLEIHYAELLMCIGFFTMYFVEECVHVYLHMKEDLMNASDAIVRRSLSVRRGDVKKSLKLKECDIHETNYGAMQHADHSHVVVDVSNNSTIAIIRGLLVVSALSIHELFEGLAVGLESSSATVWYMFGAVSAHKLVIAFCIGIELVTSNLKVYLIVIYVFTFAVVSPLGIGIGILVTNNSGGTSISLISVILQGLASGTLMYVVFFEILQADKKSGLKQYLSILVGFITMFGVTLLG